MSSVEYRFFKEPEDHEALKVWWADLNSKEKGKPSRAGWRAELRRADEPGDVLLSQGFRALYFKLPKWTGNRRLLALAAVAGVVSHVTDADYSTSFAAQLAAERESKKPFMSESRFSQMRDSETLEELFKRMIRAVKLLRGRANILSIADGIFHWSTEMIDKEVNNDPRKKIKVRWGMEYFKSLPEVASNKP